MTPRDICVVIPVLNEATEIATAIQSVHEAGQIIVVDGGSTDETVEIVKSYAAVTLVSARAGRGHQLAVGASHCHCPVMLFLHGDGCLSSSALVAVAAAVEDGHCWGALRQSIALTQWQYRWLEAGNAARVRLRGLPFGDQAIFVQTELYQQVGGFEDIPLMEDVRLSQRLRRHTWPVLIGAEVVVNPRRWQSRGVLRQTLRNWRLQCLHAIGVSPAKLSQKYHT